jgi:hypothetical protein
MHFPVPAAHNSQPDCPYHNPVAVVVADSFLADLDFAAHPGYCCIAFLYTPSKSTPNINTFFNGDHQPNIVGDIPGGLLAGSGSPVRAAV